MSEKKIPSLSLAIITNSGEHLAKTIGSVAPFVDEIVIVDNGVDKEVKKIANRFKAVYAKVRPETDPEYFCEFPKGNFEPHFTKLRRLSFELCTKDWILWLDSDDIFLNATNIRDTLINAENMGLNVISLRYRYIVDDEGRLLQVHNKERFVKNGEWQWEYDEDWAVHENLYPIDKKNSEGTLDIGMEVEHERKMGISNRHSTRNYNILMWMLQKDKFKQDPRVWFLLGRELMGLGRYDLMLQAFDRYLGMEYAPHDALDACIKCSEVCEASSDFQGAVDYAMKGIGIRPDHPLGYLYVARYMIKQGRHDDALDFLKQAEKKRLNPLDSFVSEPLTMAWLAVKGFVDVYHKTKQYDKAIDIIDRNKDRFSKDWREELESNRKEILGSRALDENITAIERLVENKRGEAMAKKVPLKMSDVEPIFDLFNGNVRMTKTYFNLKRETGDFRVHDKNEITIVHVNNFEEWDPETIYNNGGGGSETACVELSTWWQSMGWKVVVYANPRVDGTDFKGVTWRKFENINLADKFNIFISLRSPDLFTEYDIDHNLSLVWLQDIMIPEMYTQELLDKVDKICVLSDYHRNTAVNVPEGKFYYTTNGINIRLIEEVEKENIKRIKNKAIYISSADRGLGELIRMYPKMKLGVPDLDLSWAYGWNSWDSFGKTNPSAMKFKKQLIKGMKKNGIHELGRISKKDLYRLILSSEWHTYPLIGPAETSCIAVMETQALGAVPITTGITALEQTQQWGVKVPLSNYTEAFVASTTDEELTSEEYRQKMMKWARETFDWEKVAQRWIDDLFSKVK